MHTHLMVYSSSSGKFVSDKEPLGKGEAKEGTAVTGKWFEVECVLRREDSVIIRQSLHSLMVVVSGEDDLVDS
jgi:hypothetical protein